MKMIVMISLIIMSEKSQAGKYNNRKAWFI